MAIRKIIEVPDKRLKTISAPVAEVTDATRALMDDMLDSMYAAVGIGLAAIQIGVAERVVVMDLKGKPDPDADLLVEKSGLIEEREADEDDPLADEGPRYFVNPEVVWTSKETHNYQEGCLSVPSFYDDVERPAQCRVKFLDYDGKPQELECDGLLATCIQHEIDHLNGIVFLDHLSRLKRQMVLKKMRKAEREKQADAASGSF